MRSVGDFSWFWGSALNYFEILVAWATGRASGSKEPSALIIELRSLLGSDATCRVNPEKKFVSTYIEYVME